MNQSTPRDKRGVLFGERGDQLVFGDFVRIAFLL